MRVKVKIVYLAAFIKLSRVIQFVVPVPGKRFLILLKAHRMLLLVVVKLKLRSFLSLDEGFAPTNSVLSSPLSVNVRRGNHNFSLSTNPKFVVAA